VKFGSIRSQAEPGNEDLLYAFLTNSVPAVYAGRAFLEASALPPIFKVYTHLACTIGATVFTLFLGFVGVLRAAWSGCMGWVKFGPKILPSFFDLPKKINYAYK